MLKKRIFPFLALFILGAVVFLLPIREHDYLRLRYFVGLWFFAEAAFLVAQGENRLTPLYQLVWRYHAVRDKMVAGIALLAFFSILYMAVWLLMDVEFFWAVKLSLAIATVLVTWLVYYGICYMFGSRDLRDGVTPKFIQDWFRRSKRS
jgi:hypothetical protein